VPQIKESFVWSNVNTKSTLKYTFEFYSDVSFIGKMFSKNWHLLFVLTWLILDLKFVFLLLSLLVSVQPYISKIFFRIMSENKCSHKCAANYQTYLENQLNNFWTLINSMLMKYHTSDSAVWIRIIRAQFGGQVLGTLRLTPLKLFPDKVFS
jgi:Na+-transporting methylmalonyl-CoA/oxaloacetate decarboxylase gamma subunit